jgi:hypothetical protein
MIVSETYKLVFIRHQKTASSSIISKLNLNAYPSGIRSHAHWNSVVKLKTNKHYDGHHIPLSELSRIYPETHENISKYFKFSFTRNPWGRMVSSWLYLKKNNNTYNQLSFVDWLKSGKGWKGVEMNTLDFAKGCDFIGKFENLQEDFGHICNIVGITEQQLPHLNKTSHKHYTEYYDNESREIVAEQYAKDIEYFGYKFEN